MHIGVDVFVLATFSICFAFSELNQTRYSGVISLSESLLRGHAAISFNSAVLVEKRTT